MGILSDHDVPHTVSDKRPVSNSDLATSNDRAAFNTQVYTATDESGVLGTPKGSPLRINARVNGVLVP